MDVNYHLIYQKINNLKSLEDKAILKELISEVLIQSHEYHNEIMENLKKNIYEDIKIPTWNYDIMTTVCPRKDFDRVNGVFFPMKPLEELSANLNNFQTIEELNLELNQNGKALIDEIFMEADYFILQALMQSQSIFKGIIQTDKNQYSIKVQLEQNTHYLDMIQELKEYFIRNQVEYRVMNSAFLYKFLNVYIITMEKDINTSINYSNEEKESEKILNITYHLGEYEKYRKDDMLPLWNVEFMQMQSSTFPVPQEDSIYYQSDIFINKENTLVTSNKNSEMKNTNQTVHDLPYRSDGYLIMLNKGFDGYIQYYRDKISIFSKISKLTTWPVIRIINSLRVIPKISNYPIMSNYIKNDFIHRYANYYQRNLRTEGELNRKLNSYEVSDVITYISYEILEHLEKGVKYINYKYNKSKPYMILYFERKYSPHFLDWDIVDFLVKTVVDDFPEYQVLGKLV